MVTVGTYEAKTRLSELLDMVESGEEVAITRHGQEVARLVPPGTVRQIDHKNFMARIESWRKQQRNFRLDGLSVRELKNMGRR